MPIRRIFGMQWEAASSTWRESQVSRIMAYTTLAVEEATSEIEAPGNYTMQVLYHNDVAIVDREDISDRIVSRSPRIKLEDKAAHGVGD